MRTFQSTSQDNPTDLVNYYVQLSQNSSAQNIALGKTMINDAHRYLLEKYYFNETSTTIATVSGQQGYNFPYNYSILKDLTITVGQLRWTPQVILTREQWDQVNMLPYTSDIPQYIFIYNNQVQVFPIPSTTGNTITFNYKFRVPELTLPDYATGTVALTNGSTTVTGSGTTWMTPFIAAAGSVLARNIWIKFSYPGGDGNWYQVLSFTSNTVLTLASAYQGPTGSSVSFVMGQTPAILEDFQDLLVYRPLTIYFSTIQKDPVKLAEFKGLYESGIERMDNYVGEKVVNVNLGLDPQPTNPNLFLYRN